MRWIVSLCFGSDACRQHIGRGRKPVRAAGRAARPPNRRPHHQQSRNDTARQFPGGSASPSPRCAPDSPAHTPITKLVPGIQLDRRIAAGIMDALLPINLNARAYERAVAAALSDRDQMPHQRPIYRLYEVQNGNYIETYQDTFPRLELVQPHAQRAFHLLTEAVQARLRPAAGPVHPAWRLDRSHAHSARALPRALRRTVSGGW